MEKYDNLHSPIAEVQICFNKLLALSWVSEVYLRDELAHFHLDNGVLKLDFQKLSFHWNSLAGLISMWGEYSQHPHVAAHHHLVYNVTITENNNRCVRSGSKLLSF